mmetsp:Transcript_23022/g.38983  ORF Transcript_23022/g.38983 Transcript_23022/m.38983 type:complete len:326 (+) Transcript_23022:3610-4587(+)
MMALSCLGCIRCVRRGLNHQIGGRQVTFDRWRQAHQHPNDAHQFVAHVRAARHPVQHPVIQQIFGPLKPLGQFLADGLLDHAGTCKANQCIWLGNMYIAQHRIGRGHAPGCGMRQHNDVGQARLFQHLHSHGRTGHLHQAQDAFLHARASCGGEQHQRPLELHRLLGGSNYCIAHIHPHGPGHKAEVLSRSDDGRAPNLTCGDQHRLVFARRLLGGAHAIRVLLLISELQRVRHRRRHGNLGKDTAIKQGDKPIPWRDGHVVVAIGANVQVIAEFPVEQHGAALVAFGPQIVWRFAARKDRVDPGPDVIGDPVHGVFLLRLSLVR